MKKILFTCVLLFAFGASNAKDNIAEKGTPKSKASVSAKNEANRLTVPKSSTAAFMSCCYALSCGTACYGSGVCSQLEQYDIAAVFGVLEMHFCEN